jgi:hypothetical protein
LIEDHPQVPGHAGCVGGGLPVSRAAIARGRGGARLFFTAWVGSHYTWAPEAAELAPVYTAGTCQLAEQYLSRFGSDAAKGAR